MSKEYWNDRETKTIDKINELLNELPDFVSRYETFISDTTSVLTRRNYIFDLTIFFDYVAKELDITVMDITPDILSSLSVDFLSDYSRFLNISDRNGKARKSASSSKSRRLSSVRSLYNYLYITDQIPQNQMTKVRSPKLDEQEIIALESDESSILLNTILSGEKADSTQAAKYNNIQQFRDIVIFSVLLNTGIRVSELVGLDISDIDFRNRSLRVIRKGHSEYTTLFYNEDLSKLLEDYIFYRKSIPDVKDENALFLSSRKQRISVRTVEVLVKKYSERAGLLKHITPHKLRSTYGTALYRATGDIQLTADAMGHKSIETTSRRYVNRGQDQRKKAAEAVNIGLN